MRSLTFALGLVALSLLSVRASADEPGAAPPPTSAADLNAETSPPASPAGQAADKQAGKADASPAAEAPPPHPATTPAATAPPAPAAEAAPVSTEATPPAAASAPAATTTAPPTAEVTPAATPAAGGLVASTEKPAPPNKTARYVGYGLAGAGAVAIITGAILAGAANSAGSTVGQNNLNGVYSQTAGASLERNEVAAAMVLGAGVMAGFAGAALILNN